MSARSDIHLVPNAGAPPGAPPAEDATEPSASPPTAAHMPPPTRLPATIGNYRVLRHIATGGMADLYLAESAGGALVAIKRLRSAMVAEPGHVEMFFDEAVLALSLRHPNVVRVVELGEDAGDLFIAMEFLHGESVHSLMRTAARQQRPVPLGVSLHVILSVCAGLHYAHEALGADGKPLSIVHRDVSPQNILCTYEGAVKLLDFGIAKSTQQATATQTGVLKGNVSYMSPEHCLGTSTDRRSDIFSLGIVLYEMTLGRRLFRGHADFEVMRSIVDGEVQPPSAIDPTYDAGLEAVVMRALDKNRTRRFQTAREMGDALGAVIQRLGARLDADDMQNFFAEFYGERVEAWHDARERGESLGQHLQTAELSWMDPDAAPRRGRAGHAGDEDWAPASTGRLRRFEPAVPPPSARRESDLTLPSLRAVRATDRTILNAPAVAAAGPTRIPISAVPLPIGPRVLALRHALLLALAASMASGGAAMIAGGLQRGAAPAAIPVAAALPEPHEALASHDVRIKALPAVRRAPPPPPVAALAAAARDTPHPRHRPHAMKQHQAPSRLGQLWVVTTPRCSVRIDGALVGYSPMKVKLTPGAHVLRVVNNAWGVIRTRTIVVTRNKRTRVQLDLRHSDDDG